MDTYTVLDNSGTG